MSEKKQEKKFGQSPIFIASTMLENGGIVKGSDLTSLLKEAIHVISIGYEEKTDWGKEVNQKTENTIDNIIELFITLTVFFGSIKCTDWLDLRISN